MISADEKPSPVLGKARDFLWHFGPRCVRLISGLIGSGAVARHLGPETFGILAFATMVAMLATSLVQLGALEVLTKATAVNPGQVPSLLRSGLLLRFLGFLPAAGLIGVASMWFGHASLYAILALLPLTLVPDAVEAVFFGKSCFRQTAPVRTLAAVAGLAARLFLVAHDAPVEAFAWVTVGEGLLTGLLFLWMGRGLWRGPDPAQPQNWKKVFCQSLPLAGTALAVGLTLRLDQFILQTLRPGADVGHYLAVVRMFEMAYVIIPSFLAVLLPDFARWRHLNANEYQLRMIRLYTLTYRWGFVASCGLALLAPWVVPLIFGGAFRPGIPIFMVYAFTLPSFVVGNIRAMDFVVRDQNIHHLTVILCLLPIQIPLCWWMVTWAGPVGLALAMVAVTFISTTAFSLMLPPLRETGRLQAMALKSLFFSAGTKN